MATPRNRRRAPQALLAPWLLAGLAACSPPVPRPPPVLTAEVVRSFPHDPQAFTQGLDYDGGALFEGTGLYGRSELRRVELETGRVLQRRALPPDLFGEGIAVVGPRVLQLTWQSHLGLVYDKATLAPHGRFKYPTEGWGLAYDGRRLILSDGTARLYFLDPDTFRLLGTLAVRDGGRPVDKLNELECVRGQLFANVWGTDRLARIDPTSGAVTAWVRLDDLWPAAARDRPEAVLNGIAYDADGDRLFVTGKYWPRLYEIRLRPADAPPPRQE